MTINDTISLVAGDEIVVQPLNDNFTYLKGRVDSTDSIVSAQSSSIATINTSINSLQTPGVITLTGTTPVLTDNRSHYIRIVEEGTTTFTLPLVSDGANKKMHQMLVLIDMPTAKTINFGTDRYFGGYAPDLSEGGVYTLIYEYDHKQGTNAGAWVVGALYKSEYVEPSPEPTEASS